MTKVSSINLRHKWGVWGSAKGLYLKLFHEQVGNEGANEGTHNCTMNMFKILILEEEVSAFKAELQLLDYLLDGHVDPLW